MNENELKQYLRKQTQLFCQLEGFDPKMRNEVKE